MSIRYLHAILALGHFSRTGFERFLEFFCSQKKKRCYVELFLMDRSEDEVREFMTPGVVELVRFGWGRWFVWWAA